MRQVATIVCSGVLLGVIACNADDSVGASACEQGSEGCDCYGNETCDVGLRCTDDLKCEDEGGAPTSSGSGSGGNGSGGATGGGAGGSGSGGDTSSGTGGTEPGSGGSASGSGGTSASGSGGTSSNGSGGNASGSGGTSSSGSGGTASGSGGMSSGGASGGTGGSGGVSGGSGGSGGTPTNPGLIDDFADCDEAIPEIEGRNGSWYTFASDDTSIESAIGLAPSSTNTIWGDQTCGAFLNGLCPGCATAGIGVILNDGVHDLSPWLGIRFTVESAGPVYVAVKTTNGSDYGYAWGAVAYTGVSSATRTVYFADLEPDASFHGFDRAQEIQFTVDDYGKEYGFRLAVHRLELFD